VADTGMGIAATEMGHLFEPFRQTASGLKVQEGTGLGLAISREFVRLMGGEIQVASAPGQGSRFWFTLPLAEAEPAPSAPMSQNALPVLGVAAGQPVCRILIVDGQAEDRAPLLAWLGSLNPEPPVLEFREAADGHEAMAWWARWQPHLLLMDMHLPGLSGEEVTRQIKAQMAANSDLVRTVVIAFSDGTTGAGSENTPACGCDETVRKPFRAEELYAVLQRRAGLRLLHGPKPNAPPAVLSDRGLASHLAECPAEWRDALRAALDSGDFNKVIALVGQLSEQDPALHARLAKWAYDCDHEAMIRIFEGLP
jgi:CheY-like chemotaxis protein